MTLSISDTDANTKRAATTAFVYLLISLFLVLFGAIYEVFSHQVYSFYMLYAFVFPLAGGVLPFSGLQLFCANWHPCSFALNLYHCGIATLTVGSVVQGVLEIYGTTNILTRWYWFIGIVLILLSILASFGMGRPSAAPNKGSQDAK